MSFKISASPGGSQTKSGVAHDDLWPTVDVSVGASDNANKVVTTAVMSDIMQSVRPTLDGMKVPILASDIGGGTWSWGNQSTATAAQDARGNLVITKPTQGGAHSISAVFRAIPVGSWACIMEYDSLKNVQNYCMTGLAMRESGTGNIAEWGDYNNAGSYPGNLNLIYGGGYTSQTSAGFTVFVPGCRFLKVTFNGTNYVMYASTDGINFLTLGTYAKTTLFTSAADQIGPCVNNYNSGFDASLIVKDFIIG